MTALPWRVGPAADHQRQDVAAPALANGLLHVPEAGGEVLDSLYQQDVVAPGNMADHRGRRQHRRVVDVQLCHGLWHIRWSDAGPGDRTEIVPQAVAQLKIMFLVSAVERDHSLDIPLGEAFDFRDLVVQVAGQLGDNARTPAFLPLTDLDGSADVPIETDQLCIGGECGPHLCGADGAA